MFGRHMRAAVSCALLFVAGAPVGLAQPTAVAVETNVPDAVVYADSIRLGVAAESPFLLPPGTQHVRLLPPAAGSWSIAPQEAAVEPAPGDTLRLAFDFPYTYLIESIPHGATVIMETPDGRRAIGTTPLRLAVAEPLDGSLLLERGGYISETVEPGRELWNTHRALLRPTMPRDDDTNTVSWRPPTPRLQWIDYAALGLAVGSGALAVHYKFKADRRFEQYEETTDPALRSEIRRYDTRSAIALGGMQVGLGVFGLRLVLR